MLKRKSVEAVTCGSLLLLLFSFFFFCFVFYSGCCFLFFFLLCFFIQVIKEGQGFCIPPEPQVLQVLLHNFWTYWFVLQ